jgi:hypothetical protein
MESAYIALLIFLPASLASLYSQTDSLGKIAADFWAWRAKHAPFTGDEQLATKACRCTLDQRRRLWPQERKSRIDASVIPASPRINGGYCVVEKLIRYFCASTT